MGPDNAVVGVEHDGFPDNDKFLLHLRNLLTERVKPCLVEFVEYGMVNVAGKWICHVQCKASSKEVWLKTDRNAPAQFFVRNGPSSTPLDGPDMVQYIREHFDQKGSPTTPQTVQ